MRDLTGAPSYEYIIEETPEIFEKIMAAIEVTFICCAATYCKTKADEELIE